MPEGIIAGHPTHWRVIGTGARPALLLHCSLAHSGAWSGLAARLGDALTMTAPDLPSHGCSADWDGVTPLHDLSTAIAADLAFRIGNGSPVDVIGHSFGGTIAFRLALERPDLVRSLTLIEPVLFSAARLAGAQEYAAEQAAHPPFDAALREGRLNDAARWFHARWGMAPGLDDMPDAQRRYLIDRIPVIPAVDDVLDADSAGMMVPGRPEGINIPVLLIDGAASPPIIGAILRALAARLPKALRLTVPGARAHAANHPP